MLFLANNSELSYHADYPQIQIRHTNKKHAGNTEILSVRQRVTYNTMVLLYNMEKSLLPDYLCYYL
jgi:hypothetical protein